MKKTISLTLLVYLATAASVFAQSAPQKASKDRSCDSIDKKAYSQNILPIDTKEYLEKRQTSLDAQKKKIQKLLQDLEKTHKRYIKLFPESKNYHEVKLEDLALTYISGKPSSSQVTVSFHYDKQGSAACIILDSMKRPINQTEHWTHKIIRFRPKQLDDIELEAKRASYRRLTNLQSYAVDVRYQVLRSLFANLLSALYKMEIMLSVESYRRNKNDTWQSEL